MSFKLKSFDLFIGVIIVEPLQLGDARAGGSACPRGSGALCWSRVHFVLRGPPLLLAGAYHPSLHQPGLSCARQGQAPGQECIVRDLTPGLKCSL